MEDLKLTIIEGFASFKEKFIADFVTDSMWKFLANGLLTTLKITFFALIIGIVLGFFIGIIRSTYDKNILDKKSENFLVSLLISFLEILNKLSKIYLTVIRGTPVVVQLLIIYYVVFRTVNIDKVFVAVMAFGLNSAAYVAEIVRSGIMSVDQGQFEAGRTLGFNYVRTMWHIVMPQAFKNMLPALANEFIVLLKETSVSGYIALNDLTRGGDIIRSITYDPLLPLLAVALIYLIVVMILTKLVSILERRLRKSER